MAVLVVAPQSKTKTGNASRTEGREGRNCDRFSHFSLSFPSGGKNLQTARIFHVFYHRTSTYCMCGTSTTKRRKQQLSLPSWIDRRTKISPSPFSGTIVEWHNKPRCQHQFLFRETRCLLSEPTKTNMHKERHSLTYKYDHIRVPLQSRQ